MESVIIILIVCVASCAVIGQTLGVNSNGFFLQTIRLVDFLIFLIFLVSHLVEESKEVTYFTVRGETCPGGGICRGKYHCCKKAKSKMYFCCANGLKCGLNNNCRY